MMQANAPDRFAKCATCGKGIRRASKWRPAEEPEWKHIGPACHAKDENHEPRPANSPAPPHPTDRLAKPAASSVALPPFDAVFEEKSKSVPVPVPERFPSKPGRLQVFRKRGEEETTIDGDPEAVHAFLSKETAGGMVVFLEHHQLPFTAEVDGELMVSLDGGVAEALAIAPGDVVLLRVVGVMRGGA